MRALISGITGQDGAYLADFLLRKGYLVYGLKRRSSTDSTERLRALGIEDRVIIIDGDMTDPGSLRDALLKSCPQEVYNLAAQTFVKTSFDTPVSTFEVNAMGAIHLLEAVRSHDDEIRYYQASTSEMFGLVNVDSQDESTPFHPRSPYGVAKCAAHHATVNYREAYGMHASCGILFNHESPLRGNEFVTKKIADGVKGILAGTQDKLILGNLEACRDWGHAKDYVKAMWLMLQQETPDDYVIATGKTHSVREFVTCAFEAVGLRYRDYVEFDSRYLRPSDVPLLCGNPEKAQRILGWNPEYNFNSLIDEMVLGRLRAVA
jgi:GDPmannose 4,6-dehydratase